MHEHRDGVVAIDNAIDREARRGGADDGDSSTRWPGPGLSLTRPDCGARRRLTHPVGPLDPSRERARPVRCRGLYWIVMGLLTSVHPES